MPDPTPAGAKLHLPTTTRGKILVGIAALAVGYVGYRWYANKGADAGGETGTTSDVGGSLLDTGGAIGGAASGNTQYAGTTTNTGNVVSTNVAWVADAVDKLSGTGGWSASAVYQALGHFLDKKPLNQTEQNIVSAAIAASGNPPQGGPYTIIAQVTPTNLAAPTGLHAVSVSKTGVKLAWNKVTGASYYRVYRSGVSTNVGAGGSTDRTIGGLSPNHKYQFWVTSVSSTGKESTKSAPITVTTKK